MGWDDSDEEDEDEDAIQARVQAQLKEKERQRRRDEGLSSESEKEEAEAKPKAKAKPKPKPKPKAEPEKVLTAEERKLLQRQMEEESDARLAGDLFAGFEKPKSAGANSKTSKVDANDGMDLPTSTIVVNDAFDRVALIVQADVENLAGTCLEKLEKAKPPGCHSLFCSTLMKQLEPELSSQELGDIEKLIAEILKEKKVQKGAQLAKDNKANTKLSKTTKFNAASEWEEVYGGGEDDEDWTQEEWDEWNKQQAAAGAAGAGEKWS